MDRSNDRMQNGVTPLALSATERKLIANRVKKEHVKKGQVHYSK